MPKQIKDIFTMLDDIEKVADYVEDMSVEYGYYDQKHPKSDLNLAELAYTTEHGKKIADGTKWDRVPRPLMRNAELKVEQDWKEYCAELSEAAIRGNKSYAKKALSKAANAYADDIREAILDQDFVPLSDSTVKRKGHNTILVETSTLYDKAKGKVVKGD